jgi:hypothetical protein
VQERAGAPLAVVARPWLLGLLAGALPEGAVRTAAPVTAVDDAGTHVEVEGFGRADAVVAADGAGSRIRATLFPQHPGLVGSAE